MSSHVVIIGAVALGPKAACRFKRLMPESRVTLVDQAEQVSYGGCGIPFYVSGEISRVEDLRSTPYGALRDEGFFRDAKGVELRTKTRALRIDRARKTVLLEDLRNGKQEELSYDQLVLATGSRPNIPPLPGVTLRGIGPATNLEEAEAIRNAVSEGKAESAVVLGGGFIGLEMAVALAELWGIPVTVLEMADQLLPGFLSPTLARMAARDMEEGGVTIRTGIKVLSFEGENGAVRQVLTDAGAIPSDLVVLATGIRPETALAKEAGLSLTEKGLILVDEELRSSDPDIYAGGDCVAIPHQVTGKPFWLPLGSQANRQGRVIGGNLAGRHETFPGAVGSWGVKLFGQSAAGAGLTLSAALAEGLDAVSVHVEQVDRAHFYPEHAMMALELVVERGTRRLLGIQGMAASGDALVGRVNAVTPLLAARGTAHDLSTLEVVYSPPFASAMDIVNLLGNVAENILEGRCRTMDPLECEALWDARENGTVCFLDTRVKGQAEKHPALGDAHWLAIPQDELAARIAEVPTDKDLVLICNTGLRAYEAQLSLNAHARPRNRTVSGGLAALGRMGIQLCDSGEPEEE